MNLILAISLAYASNENWHPTLALPVESSLRVDNLEKLLKEKKAICDKIQMRIIDVQTGKIYYSCIRKVK